VYQNRCIRCRADVDYKNLFFEYNDVNGWEVW
jgi:hypothetical protein